MYSTVRLRAATRLLEEGQAAPVGSLAALLLPPAEGGAVHAWQAAIQDAMNANGAALAAATSSRDPSAFDTLVGGGSARIHPVYDAFLRLTGRRTAIETAHRAPERASR